MAQDTTTSKLIKAIQSKGKQVVKIDRFEGGLNNYFEERDIPDNSFIRADNVMFDKVGRIRVSGSSIEFKGLINSADGGVNGTLHDENQSGIAEDFTNYILNSSYGLYNFNSDFNLDEDGSAPLEVPTEFIVFTYKVPGGQIKTVFIDSKFTGHGALWKPNVFTWTDDDFSQNDTIPTYPVKPIYYYADGGLRVSDSEFRNESIGGVDSFPSTNHKELSESYNNVFIHVKRVMFSEILTATYGTGAGVNGIWIKEKQTLEKTTRRHYVELTDASLKGEFGCRPNEQGSQSQFSTSGLDATLQMHRLSNDKAAWGYSVQLEIEEEDLIDFSETDPFSEGNF